jgi:ribonuclease P/MRP protein subunit RPP1
MPFVDLSVRIDPGNPHALREHLVCCLDLGYQAVALDTLVEATDRNARAELLAGLEPLRADVLREVAADATSRGARPELVVLRRCTVRFAEPGQLQEMVRANDDAIRSYDVFALEPTTERAFASACTNGRADIVTTQLGARPAFRLRAPALKAAASAGASFEVSYNAALMDVGARRNFFANAAAATRAVGENAGGGVRDDDDSDDDTDDDTDAVMRVGSASANDERLVNDLSRKFAKRVGGGVVLTSGSRQATELRAPHDVANLASLFGMRDENARAALSTRALRLVRRARRTRARERRAAGDK